MVDAEHPEFTWYGEPSDALPLWFLSLSTHKPLFYWSVTWSAQERYFAIHITGPTIPCALFAKTKTNKEKKESNTCNIKKHSESANLRLDLDWGVWNSLVMHETVLPLFSCVISNRSWIFCENQFTLHNVAIRIQKLKKQSQDVPDCSLCDILQISWNPFMIFSMMLLTDMTPGLVWGPWISLVGHNTV